MDKLVIRNTSLEVIDSIYQWDENRTVILSGFTISDSLSYEVHFSDCRSRVALVVIPQISTIDIEVVSPEGSTVTEVVDVLIATVPQSLIAHSGSIRIYVCSTDGDTGEQRVVVESVISVIRRVKPANYEYDNPDDVLTAADGLIMEDGVMYLAKGGVKFGTGVSAQGGSSSSGLTVMHLSGTTACTSGATTIVEEAT